MSMDIFDLLAGAGAGIGGNRPAPNFATSLNAAKLLLVPQFYFWMTGAAGQRELPFYAHPKAGSG